MKSWVANGGLLDHLPILLDIESESIKPPAPFKSKSNWVNEEDLRKIVIQNWEKFDSSMGDTVMYQFATNLKREKRLVDEWARKIENERKKDLKEMKSEISNMFKYNDPGIFAEEESQRFKSWKKKRKSY